MRQPDNPESRMKRARWHTRGRLFRARTPSKEKNVLATWLEQNRGWVKESEAMAWLAREHGALVAGCVLPEEMTAEHAVVALGLVRARLRKG